MKKIAQIKLDKNKTALISNLILCISALIAIHLIDIKKSTTTEDIEQRLDSIEYRIKKIDKRAVSNKQLHIHIQ